MPPKNSEGSVKNQDREGLCSGSLTKAFPESVIWGTRCFAVRARQRVRSERYQPTAGNSVSVSLWHAG
jgi:hypothetical protein